MGSSGEYCGTVVNPKRPLLNGNVNGAVMPVKAGAVGDGDDVGSLTRTCT